MFTEVDAGMVAGKDDVDVESERGNVDREEEERSKSKSLDLEEREEEGKDVEDGGIQPSRWLGRGGIFCQSASERRSRLRFMSTTLSKSKSKFRDGREGGVRLGSRSITTGDTKAD